MQVTKNHTFLTNYYDYESMGNNPANLTANRREGKKVSFGLLQLNMLMYSGPLKRDLMHGGSTQMLGDAGHWFDDILVERTFVGMDNTILGLNFHTKKAGSFSLNVKNNIQVEAELNGAFEDLNFDGSTFSNLPDIIMNTIKENPDNLPPGNMSMVRMSVINEFGLAYSKKLLTTKTVHLYGGMGVKYLMGFADLGIQFNNHQVAGYYSLSSLLPDAFAGDSTSGEVQSGQKFAHGAGFSGGLALRFQKLKASLSFVDAGFINWPAKEISFTKEDAVMEALTEDDIQDAIDNVISDNQRTADGKEKLPVKMMFGTSYEVHKYVAFYLDLIAPLNNSPRNMTRPTIGLGTWLSAKGFATLKTGVNLIDKKYVTLPMYLSLFSGENARFELSAGTSDFLAFFIPGREYMHLEAAILKFHF